MIVFHFGRMGCGVSRCCRRSIVPEVTRRPARSLRLYRLLNASLVAVMLVGLIATSGAVFAQDDTASSVSSEAGGLSEMITHVPALLPELQRPETATISYANIAAQLESLGVAPPTSLEDPSADNWSRAIAGLRLPEVTMYTSRLRADFGFDLTQIDETLEVSAPPFRLTLFRGRFDQMAVLAALENLGYRPVVPGSAVLVLRGDFENDLASQTGYATAAMNVATFLNDGTLVFAPARTIIEAVRSVQAGDRESLAQRGDIATILPYIPADLASAIIVPGEQLRASGTAVAHAEIMQPVTLALIGYTVGGPYPPNLREGTSAEIVEGAPVSRGVMVLLMNAAAGAAAAVPVVESRLSTEVSGVTQRPMISEVYSNWEVRAVPGEPVLLIDFTVIEGKFAQKMLFEMWRNGDLYFIQW